MRLLLFSIVLIIAPLATNAQLMVNDNCKKAYNNILSLKFDKAKEQLSIEKRVNPDNTYILYLENYIDFLTLFIGEDESDFNRLEDNKSNRIKQINRLDDSLPQKNYMLGNIHLQWAVARIKFKEYFTAALEINKAYRLLERNSEDFPNYIPNNISLGVLHILIGIVPDNYKWILNLISMEGSVEQGMAELDEVFQHSKSDSTLSYLKNETLFYLGFVQLNINPSRKQSMALLTQLEDANKDNLLLSYLKINTLIRIGQNDSALSIFSNIKNRKGYFPFYYLDYVHGECLLNKLETTPSRAQYSLFLKNFSGKNYIKDAHRKIAWTYLIIGDTSNYIAALTRTEEFGNDDVGVDKESDKEASSNKLPNVELLKTRLLFDGGYYDLADSLIHSINVNKLSSEDELELSYRKARIFHESGKVEQAKTYYKTTIENKGESQRYFAPNSALKLAGIYESEDDNSQAEVFYKMCLKMKFDEYESSIKSKAKAGLKRVSD